MFAGDNAAVAETDIVVTVDANMFVMSPEIIRPLISSPDRQSGALSLVGIVEILCSHWSRAL